MNSSDYTLQAVKGIRKVFQNAMENLLDKFMENRVVNFYGTDEVDEIFTSTESLVGIEISVRMSEIRENKMLSK